MVLLHTPQGKFSTTLFAIADKIPERIVAECNKKPLTAHASELGYPYICELPLGGLSSYECHALNLILTIAISKLPKPQRDDYVVDVIQNHDTTPSTCHLQIHMRHDHMPRHDVLDLKQHIQTVRDDLLDPRHYKQIKLMQLDALRTYLERTFTPEEKYYAQTLELMMRSYGKDSAITVNQTIKDRLDLLILDKKAFIEVAKIENTRHGASIPTSKKQRSD